MHECNLLLEKRNYGYEIEMSIASVAVIRKLRLLQSYEVFWIHVIDAICNSVIFIQLPNTTSVTILIRIDPDWDWSRDRYETILLRIVVFSDHLKANFWSSQEPIIVYEFSWLSFDNLSLYHVHYVPCHIWRKSRSTWSISFESEPGSKSRWSYAGSLQKHWVIFKMIFKHIID